MKKISLIFVVIAVLALVLVGACGGDGDDETSAAQTSAQTSNPTTQPSSSEPETTTTESSGGNGGGGFTWDDVPIYGGADQVQEFNISIPPEEGEYSRVEWRYYETGDDIDDVIDFYKDKMPDNGWDEVVWMDMMEVAYGMYMKNNEADAAMVWLSSTNGDTQIALWRASE
jgi:hypothetical protein